MRIALALVSLAACRAAVVDYFAPPSAIDPRVSLGTLGRLISAALAVEAERQREHAPPPAQLAPSDGSELALRELRADVAIAGPLAHTELAFTFHNGEARVREGRFSLALPDGATVTRFAMKIGGEWREARVVSREQGRQVYEQSLHRGVDPALLEQDAGHRFSARVFPIAANADKEIVIAYDYVVADAAPYALPLRGLPALPHFVARVDRDGAAVVRIDRGGVAPDDVVVPIAGGDAAVGAGDAFVARVELAADRGPARLDRVTILVDTSASRATIAASQADVVSRLVAALPGNAAVTIAAFDVDVAELYRGPARGAGAAAGALIDRGALGASDLGAALARATAGGGRVILVGDGAATAGEREPAKLAAIVAGSPVERVDAVVVGQSIERPTLAALVAAGKRPGAILDGRDPRRVARQLAHALPAVRRIVVAGATASWPATTAGVAPGDPVYVFGLRAGDATAPLAIRVGDRDTFVVPVSGDAARVRRAVAGAELAALAERAAVATGDERAQLARRMQELALAHGLISAQTSLIVLESDADERRLLDPTSQSQGITLSKEYLQNIPVPGRRFEAALGAAAGSQGDSYGHSFSGSTSVENVYYVDGLNASIVPMAPAEPTYPRPHSAKTLAVFAAIARGDRDGAVVSAARWQTSAPGDVAAVLALGEALEARGARRLAVRAYSSLADLYPNRAEYLRLAGERLDRIDDARARELAIDAYRRAIRERPDQVTSYRLLAYDLLRARSGEALDVLAEAIRRASRASISRVLDIDHALASAYLEAHAPALRDFVRSRRRAVEATKPAIYIVATWDVDAVYVDLHVRDARGGHASYTHTKLDSGGELIDDARREFGASMFVVEQPRAAPYRIGVHYWSHGPEGIAPGTVQIIRHDGAGNLEIETRPFVIENDNAMIELGEVNPATSSRAPS